MEWVQVVLYLAVYLIIGIVTIKAYFWLLGRHRRL
jgi:hypothetical protein